MTRSWSDLGAAVVALVRHPRGSRDQIVAFRNARLRRVVRHAYRTVPLVTQEREDRVVLRVVPGRAPSPDELARAEADGRVTLEPRVEFRIVLVPEIPFEPSGKFRYSRSLVWSAYDDPVRDAPARLEGRSG